VAKLCSLVRFAIIFVFFLAVILTLSTSFTILGVPFSIADVLNIFIEGSFNLLGLSFNWYMFVIIAFLMAPVLFIFKFRAHS